MVIYNDRNVTRRLVNQPPSFCGEFSKKIYSFTRLYRLWDSTSSHPYLFLFTHLLPQLFSHLSNTTHVRDSVRGGTSFLIKLHWWIYESTVDTYNHVVRPHKLLFRFVSPQEPYRHFRVPSQNGSFSHCLCSSKGRGCRIISTCESDQICCVLQEIRVMWVVVNSSLSYHEGMKYKTWFGIHVYCKLTQQIYQSSWFFRETSQCCNTTKYENQSTMFCLT